MTINAIATILCIIEYKIVSILAFMLYNQALILKSIECQLTKKSGKTYGEQAQYSLEISQALKESILRMGEQEQ